MTTQHRYGNLYFRCFAPAILFCLAASSARAEILTSPDSAPSDLFGCSVSSSGDNALVGAYGAEIGANAYQGAAYYFKGLDNASGAVSQNVKLTASDGAKSDGFGRSVSLSGDNALVGAYGADIGANTDQGAAYYIKGLDNASGAVSQNVKLTASDGVAGDRFGYSVSLSGDNALVSNYSGYQGEIYYFKNLDSNLSGTATQNVKLTASDSAASPVDYFGNSVSLSGDNALVGAPGADIGAATHQGAAYYFKGLDSASGTVTQNVKLTASDGAEIDYFGISVSLSGDNALVGAYGAEIGANDYQGAAYYFKGLDSASGTATQNVKLTASDGAEIDKFGNSVSLSGDNALVGAYYADIGANTDQGAAYYFKGLDSTGSAATQTLKIVASDGAKSDKFGNSVSLSGDNFAISAVNATSSTGKVYTGTISSMTTLDVEGGAARMISGISFTSWTNWTIGSTYSNNTVTLASGNTATMLSGCNVYIGQNAGSNHNTLVVSGTISAGAIYVGNTNLNDGNVLEFTSSASKTITTINLAPYNTIKVSGDYSSNIDELLGTYFAGTTINVYDLATSDWTMLTGTNYSGLVTLIYDGALFTSIVAVPESATWAFFGSVGALGLTLCRRRVRV